MEYTGVREGSEVNQTDTIMGFIVMVLLPCGMMAGVLRIIPTELSLMLAYVWGFVSVAWLYTGLRKGHK